MPKPVLGSKLASALALAAASVPKSELGSVLASALASAEAPAPRSEQESAKASAKASASAMAMAKTSEPGSARLSMAPDTPTRSRLSMVLNISTGVCVKASAKKASPMSKYCTGTLSLSSSSLRLVRTTCEGALHWLMKSRVPMPDMGSVPASPLALAKPSAPGSDNLSSSFFSFFSFFSFLSFFPFVSAWSAFASFSPTSVPPGGTWPASSLPSASSFSCFASFLCFRFSMRRAMIRRWSCGFVKSSVGRIGHGGTSS
mmetsp:Transcript_98566/g.306976  ORF Transcript_98566/g.306976 Transcript_98566/m.306976 type:complete len:259 (-) Transcript_98566:517-1293(-)